MPRARPPAVVPLVVRRPLLRPRPACRRACVSMFRGGIDKRWGLVVDVPPQNRSRTASVGRYHNIETTRGAFFHNRGV